MFIGDNVFAISTQKKRNNIYVGQTLNLYKKAPLKGCLGNFYL